jgi:hypothetical protein
MGRQGVGLLRSQKKIVKILVFGVIAFDFFMTASFCKKALEKA